MTDSKSWLWRKRSSEKNIVVASKVDVTSKANEEEIHVLLAEKAELERALRDLNDKLSSALSECDAKDELAKKHAKTAQEALAGWEKAEAKSQSLKEELEEALKQRETCEERTSHLDAALKECMQQLRFVREDQEKRILDVLLKASKELEETKMLLGEKITELNKEVAKLTAEKSQLHKMLMMKEQAIDDLTHQRAKAESDVNALLATLEGLKKDNNSLRYEVQILEKEVDIRNEEREFNRRTADAAHKQHLENVKKIAKLESECQRLRVLVRKRLPGPAAVAKMKSEVGILQRDSSNRRKNSNLNHSNQLLDYGVDSSPESLAKKVNLLTEKICTLEEENNFLRETLQQKLNELQISRNMYVKTASKLSQVETQFEESPKGQMFGDTRRSSIVSHDLTLASMSDVGSDDKASCAGSWASALISELEHFRDGKEKMTLPSSNKSVGISDMNHFMDDFAEMEKLALVCVDKPVESSSSMKDESSMTSLSETTGKELVLVPSTADANDYNEQVPSKLSRSLLKLIELIEGINLSSEVCDSLQTPTGTNGSYTVRVLQWKTSDLAAILQNFVRACGDLLNGKADFEIFAQELTSALEWIINRCFSLKDVSSMKDEIKKKLDWDETRSESEVDSGTCGTGQFPESAKLSAVKQQLQHAANSRHTEARVDMNEGGKLHEHETSMDSGKQEPELQSLKNECESLRNQLQISERTVSSLQAELEDLKLSKAIIEDEFKNHKMTIENLESQMKAVKSELDENHQKLASLEEEFKNKVNYCEELEGKCLDFQLQLKRGTKIDSSENVNHDEKQIRTEHELSAASEKLAECQETIIHLGKQLKALASSRDAMISDKYISTQTNTNTAISINPTIQSLTSEKQVTNNRSSLLDKMLAEDDGGTDQLGSPKTKEIICPKEITYETAKEYIAGGIGKKYNDESGFGPLAIVPRKKQSTSGGLIRKLLWRKRKASSKKLQLPFAA